MYFFTCRLLGYISHRGVIKPSPCLKNKNGKVKDEITAALFCLAKWRGGGEMERYRFRLRFAFFSSCIQPRSWRQIKVVLFESTVFKIALAFAFTRG